MSTPRWTPSVTVAAIIERQDADGPRFLLVEEHTPEGLRLNNPAGHLEPAESPLQGVVREALEETAHIFHPTHIVGTYLSRFQRPARDGHAAEDVTYLRFAFGGSAEPVTSARALDTGIVRTLWLTPAEIEASRERHRSALVWQCIRDHLDGARYPLESVQADPSIYTPEIKQP